MVTAIQNKTTVNIRILILAAYLEILDRYDSNLAGWYLIGQRHFRRLYKHEAQASEQVASKPTRSRVVLVFMAKQAQVALSD